MSKVDFSRGELSPIMRYRSDLAAYHQGCETLENFFPTPQGGIMRRYGSQIIGDLPDTDAEPAIRTFNLGATGLTTEIEAPSSDNTVTIGSSIYDTEDRVENIPKNTEVQILLAFSEPNIISAYWLNTASGVPAYLQQVWNYDSGYVRPVLGFDDTRDARVVQIESSVFFIGLEYVYQLYWSREKSASTDLAWAGGVGLGEDYAVGDVVKYTTYWFECFKAHNSETISPDDGDGNLYWKVVYPPYLSWKKIDLRVGEILLSGSAYDDDFDPYAWESNTVWATGEEYKLGDVVYDAGGSLSDYFECITEHTAGATFAGDSAYWKEMNTLDTSWGDDPPEDDTIYRARSVAGREETIPREIKSHQGRLIVAQSSRFPATIFGSEIARPTKFGAGLNDDDPWIYTVSGDRVGKILWMYVTDRLYLGTKGGIYAVDSLITPSQFLLRKINSHGASETEGITADGDLMYFQSDKKTLREIAYSDSQQSDSFQSVDMTLFSSHLFNEHEAIKMVVQHTPHTIVWILRSDGVLVALSYEKTVSMVAFSRHILDGDVIDISGGTGDDLYAIIERSTGDKKLLRIGGKLFIDGEQENDDIYMDGLKRFIVSDVSSLFRAYVQNDDFRSILIADGIDTIEEIQALTPTLDYSSYDISGYISQCSLRNFIAVDKVDLNDNNLTNWAKMTVPALWDDIDLSSNELTADDINQVLIDVARSVNLNDRTGTIDLSDNEAATYNGLLAAIDLYDAGWSVSIDNAAGWEDGYTLTFGANTGTGTPPSSQSPVGGESIILPDEGLLVKSGYEFIGWDASSSATNPDYEAGDTYQMPYDNETLYAIWEITYTLTYDANGGTGTAPTVVRYKFGDTVSLPTNPFTYAGKTFTEWNTVSNGSGTGYDESDEFIMPGVNTTLYAYWDKVIYSVGDIGPGGGYVFYDKGSWTDDWRYMEAAPKTWNGSSDPELVWSSVNHEISGTSENIGEGEDNTSLIVAADGSSAVAAKACSDYSASGFADWFLPSTDELIAMVSVLRNISGAIENGTSDYYWSSVDEGYSLGTYKASAVNVPSGTATKRLKDDTYYVRPVRYLIQED